MHTSYVAGFMISCTYQSKSRQIQLFNTILDKLDLLLVSINLDSMQELWITLARWSPLQSGCLGKICLDKLHPFEDTTSYFKLQLRPTPPFDVCKFNHALDFITQMQNINSWATLLYWSKITLVCICTLIQQTWKATQIMTAY